MVVRLMSRAGIWRREYWLRRSAKNATTKSRIAEYMASLLLKLTARKTRAVPDEE